MATSTITPEQRRAQRQAAGRASGASRAARARQDRLESAVITVATATPDELHRAAVRAVVDRAPEFSPEIRDRIRAVFGSAPAHGVAAER